MVASASSAIASINGVQVAFGLRWEAVSAQSHRAARAAFVALLKKAGAKHGVLNEAEDHRFVGGFCGPATKNGGNRCVSAAAWMSEESQRSRLVIAELTEGVHWVGVADPGVWIGGDFVGSRSDAGDVIDAALEHFERIGHTPEIVVVSVRADGSACQHYPFTARMHDVLAAQGIASPVMVDWTAIFSSPPPSNARIALFTGMDAQVTWLLLGVVLIGAAGSGAWSWWTQYQAEEERRRLEEEARAQLASLPFMQDALALEAERSRRKQQAIVVALERHTATARPGDVIDRCLDVLGGLGLSLRGWFLSELTCQEGSASGVWKPVPAVPVLALAERVIRRIEDANPVGVELDVSGQEIRASWTFDALPKRPAWRVDAMPDEAFLRRLLVTRSQILTSWAGGVISPLALGVMTPADITYVDPELEDQTENPARFVQVAPPEGFRLGSLSAHGVGAWRLRSLRLSERPFSVTKIVFRPSAQVVGQDVTAWTLEAEYVAR